MSDDVRNDHDRWFKELSISPIFLKDYILDVVCSLVARAPYGIMESIKYNYVIRVKVKMVPPWK